MLAFQGPVVDFLSDGPQHGIIDSRCSERKPVGWRIKDMPQWLPDLLLDILNRSVQISFFRLFSS